MPMRRNAVDTVRFVLRRVILLPDYQKRDVGYEVENKKEYFEQTDEPINYRVEILSGNGNPSTLHAIYQIRSKYAHSTPEDQQNAI